MFSETEIQSHLNQNKKDFGRASIDTRPLWSTDNITWEDVKFAGERHSCPVLRDVLNKRVDIQQPVEVWRAYQGKNNAFCEISNLFQKTNRSDLYTSWNHNELRKKGEKTHPEVKAVFQYPSGHDQHYLLANARMDQYFLSDHLRTLDHIAHGASLGYAASPEEQAKYSVSIDDYQSCAQTATNLDHFTALVAIKTAQILKNRGVEDQTIVKLLSQNFAQAGSVREYGQQKHASKIVSLVLKEIKECGNLQGIASEFRQSARPKIEKHYFGKRNPRL